MIFYQFQGMNLVASLRANNGKYTICKQMKKNQGLLKPYQDIWISFCLIKR